MNKKSVMVGVAVILALFTLNIQAQERSDARKPTRQSKELEVNKAQIRLKTDSIPVLVAKSSARKAPEWAAISAKPAGASGTSAGTRLAAAPKSELENLTLSVRHIYSTHGNLMFRLATVNSDDNYAFWIGLETPTLGYVAAALHVKKGERYLLDFKVTAQEFTTFGINVGDTVQDITVNSGDHHLLAYLDATETTRVIALLNSNTAKYTFHSLTITRVD